MQLASTQADPPIQLAQPAAANLRDDQRLFESGPPLELQRRIGMLRDGQLHVWRRAGLVVLITWAPLLVLSLLQSAFDAGSARSFLGDAGAHARFLFAAPLLILAESECGARLSAIIRNFHDAGLVRDEQRERFEAAVRSTRRLIDSSVAEIAVIALAILVIAAAAFSYPIGELPAWQRTGQTALSWGGWWHVLISLPILAILLLAWVWRFVLWALLLWRIANLDLRLVASHPDRNAGLGFLGQSLRAFSPVAMALATIAAGRSANVALQGGALPTPYLIFNVGFLVSIVVLFTAPLLVFGQPLLNLWRHATLEYGALASRVGEAFEKKWLQTRQDDNVNMLEKPDFSATTDLYGVVANVYALRLVPVDLTGVIAICIAVLLPFVPVVLLAIPMQTIWSNLKSLMF